MSDPGRIADPFGATASPAEYVARPATEEALESAEWALRSGRRVLVLTGPAGIGKTLVLRVLERRLADTFRVVYAPYASLPADELCAWVLGLLDEKSEGNPEQELLAFARSCAARSQGLVLLIDDAARIPLPTARRLGALATRSDGTLRLVLVCADEEPAERILPELGPVVEEVRLEDPMDRDETAHYVAQRLARARTPEAVRARFDPDTVAALHRRSRGLPAVLHQIAAEIVRGRETEAVVGELRPQAAPVPVDPLDQFYEEEDDLDVAVPPEFLRRRSGRAVLQAAPRTQLLLAATLLLALAAVVVPWLRPDASREPVLEPPQTQASVVQPEPVLEPEPAPIPAIAPTTPRRPAPAPRAAVPVPAKKPAPIAPVPKPAPAATPEFISVNINATPWARIAVDGVALGETPLANVRLLPGEHTITATLPTGQIIERRVTVDAEHRHFGFGPEPAPAPEPVPAPAPALVPAPSAPVDNPPPAG